jgi:hypothetical protein
MSNPIPFRPDADAVVRRERTAIHRSLAAHVCGKIHNQRPSDFAEKSWPEAERVHFLTRAASSPTDTTSASALSITKVSPLFLVAPGSAAAKLFNMAMKVDLSGIQTVSVPYVVSHPLLLWTAEGAPIAVAQAQTGAAVIGPARRLSFIVSLTRELDEATPETASAVLGRMLGQSAAKSLDAAVFDNSPASALRPAGLLNGVSPLTEAVGTGTTLDQISSDIADFARAFSDAGINSENMVIITSPRSAWQLLLTRGFAQAPLPVLMSPAIPAGTLIAVVPEAIGSGYSGLPEVEVSKFGLMHFEDTNPLPIVGPGGVVASPARGSWQTDSLGIKLRMRAAWASLQPGAVQYMTGVRY